MFAIVSIGHVKKTSNDLKNMLEIIHKLLEITRQAIELQDQDDFTDGQVPIPIKSVLTTNIEVKIDEEKSNEKLHQFIESVKIMSMIYHRLSRSRSRCIRDHYSSSAETTIVATQ
jgi:hypothetical protein